MKRTIYEILMAAVLIWVVPWFLVSFVITARPQEVQLETTEPSETIQPAPVISVKLGDEILEMQMEDYLTAVLLAEMPGSFHMEAKMAQAVVARTYALRTIAKSDKHSQAVCGDSTCCQGFRLPGDYIKAGGTQETVDQARLAVRQTAGFVLTYAGDLIDATYFACSGGYTEPAVAVWGTDVPYLQAVPSPGEESAAHYTDTVTVTPSEFAHALERELTGSPTGWFGPVTYTQGGGVAYITVAGVRYSGKELRALLNLRSTAFTITATDTQIQFVTRGHGHRVGMSQYGAQAMALNGSTWRQILEHYYPGTEVWPFWEK